MTKDEQKSPLQFPCDFIVKVMGEATPEFEQKTMLIAKRHSTAVHVEKTTKRHSKNGNYVSITLLVHFENRAQMDALYLELRETPEVLMAL